MVKEEKDFKEILQMIQMKPEIKDGCIQINREWSDDTIYITFTDSIIMERLPDRPELAAVVEGPIVLAGLTDHDCGLKGNYDDPESMFSPRSEHTYSTFTWKQNCHTTRGQDVNFEFIPLYEVTDESYTVYFSQRK